MKTAFVLSGQPRDVNNSYNYIYPKVIQPNNADVFIHMWNGEYNGEFESYEKWGAAKICSVASVLDLYKPIAFEQSPQIKFNCIDVDFTKSLAAGYAGGAENPDIARRYVFNTYSTWYSIKQALKLVPNDYDRIILSRFDVKMFPKILDNVENDDVHCDHLDRNELMLNWLIVGPRVIKHVFGGIFDQIEQIYEDTGIWCNEFWCKRECDKYKLTVRKHHWNLFL